MAVELLRVNQKAAQNNYYVESDFGDSMFFTSVKKGKYTNLSLNTRLSGDVGCAMIGIVDSFPFPDSLISIELQYIIAPVSDKDRLLTFIWEVFSFPMALVCF